MTYFGPMLHQDELGEWRFITVMAHSCEQHEASVRSFHMWAEPPEPIPFAFHQGLVSELGGDVWEYIPEAMAS